MMKDRNKVWMKANQADGRRTGSGGMRAGALAALALSALPVHATEGGGNSYPFGVETSYNGMMLPEGAHSFVYYQHYTASHFKDNAGNDSARFAHFNVESNVIAYRLSYVWPGARLFGANIETRLVQAVADVSLAAAIARPTPPGPLDVGGNDTGLADTSLSPIILGWHSPHFHQTLGIDSHLKLGSYDAGNRVNTGRNYYQVAPFYALTWFPAKGVDINAKLRYALNSSNTANNYRSGNEASLEFSAGYHVTPRFALGINGYMYRQTTDDTLNGIAVNGNGNRGRVDALGPYVSYSFTPKLTLVVKAQSEFDVRNRPQGTRVWAQIGIPF